MKLPVSEKELEERIELNYSRLNNDPYYGIGEIFSPPSYGWMGDKEGRALLAFVSHYRMSRRIIPCMEQMLEKMPSMLNEKHYLGDCSGEFIREEQLSGHSWMLRGLCEHYEAFGDAYSLGLIREITENLYLPLRGEFRNYPLRAGEGTGGVSGSEIGTAGKWLLSSDTCAAFMSIDGLSHAYRILRDERIRDLLCEMVSFFAPLDKRAVRAQTHCTLTAGRGMVRMFRETGDPFYLKSALGIWTEYVYGGGMTLTYQNLNWWGRPDTWTEPCAIVDSLMLSLELYKLTGREDCQKTAARIWHNGFAPAQRDNGGAGTDTVVTADSPWDDLFPQMKEAYFCCTMRLAEGLRYVKTNRELLAADVTGTPSVGEDGVVSDGDLVYAEPDDALLPYADEEKTVVLNGRRLAPLVKAYRVPWETLEKAKQKVRF
ncbi:MAG: hypothetical protein E7576_15225 [Ruminococcaceae bacterium]|jgi:hypothetical protein|nr:hypothetical protein [Oscillospiraceae bacterium]